MNKVMKIAASVALAASTSLAFVSPGAARGCDCYVSGDDWDAVGYEQYLDSGDSMRFDLYLEPNQTVDLWFVSELIQRHTVDLDMWIVYPDGRRYGSDDIGDDDMTIHTRSGGMFQIYIDNVDDEFATNFTLYVDA